MDSGLAVNIAAVFISLSAVALSSLFAAHQLRSMRRSDGTLVAIELLTRECRTNDFMESEEFVVYELSKNPHDCGVSGLPAEYRRHISRIGLYYSSLGVLSVLGGLDERMIITLMPSRARRAWFALEPYILAERALHSPTYLSYFEHLVCLIAEADLDKNHQSLKLRKMGSRSERFRQEFFTKSGARSLPSGTDLDAAAAADTPGAA